MRSNTKALKTNYAIANNLSGIRKERGLTQEQVEAKTGITRKALYNYESGLVVPSINSLLLLAKVYDVSLDFLVDNNVKEDLINAN